MTSQGSIRFCLEVAPAPCVLTLFGATGDLAKRKLYPALYHLHRRELLHATSFIVGCGRSRHDEDSFRQLVADALPDADGVERDAFLNRLRYVRVNEAEPQTYADLAGQLDALDTTVATPAPFNRLYYLAVPPSTCQPIVVQLSSAGLLRKPDGSAAWRHLLLEKPFGKDTASAAAFDAFLKQHTCEDDLFRIDHYLGKDTVQNILILRFANILFDPIWNARYIDHVQITVAETLGVEQRAAYYEGTGLLRDMFQNHLLEMLALVAMEPPSSYEAHEIQERKLDLIRAIRPFGCNALSSQVVRAQYASGDGLAGYREEPDVASDSQTETYAAAKLMIDTPRWQGVPFYLRSGKRLSKRTSTIALVFKPASHTLFGPCDPDALVLRVQPDEGMSLHLQAKRPGPKLCMGELPLAFNYEDLGEERDAPDSYARLLLDAMLHDHTLFVRNDTIAASWQLFTPVLDKWRAQPDVCPLHTYPAGSEGPAAADELLARDGRAWRPLA